MSSVISETIKIVKEKSSIPLEEIFIDDLVIGIFFTGVRLSNGHGGVAFTPIGEVPEAVCCPTSAARMPAAGTLGGRTVAEMLSYALDPNVLKSAIGVATLNALSQSVLQRGDGVGYQGVNGKDGFDLLDIHPHETVSLVGAFGPYIRRLKQMGNCFFVIERNPQALRPDEMKYYRPESEMLPAFQESDAVIATGTAMVNHTMDHTLSLLPDGTRAAIIGPTASMVPEAFFQRGVQVMAGIHITDPDLMIRILKQGGSAYHLLRGCSEKIAFVKK
jgi:uncharacterized protein